MSIKTYMIYCDHCAYKRITDGTDIQDLREVKTSPIPRGVPTLDPLAKKNIAVSHGHPADITTGQRIQPSMRQKKRFKCPKCGYIIMARQIKPEEYQQNEQQQQTDWFNGGQASPPGPSLPGELT